MSLTLTLSGTGGAQGVPAWGCHCPACVRAHRAPQYRRKACSGVVRFNDAVTPGQNPDGQFLTLT